MIIALKHNNTTLIGIYDSIAEFVESNFKVTIDKNGVVKIKSKHFENYLIKEITSGISYNLEEYTIEEALKDYSRVLLPKQVKKYGIKIYKVEQI